MKHHHLLRQRVSTSTGVNLFRPDAFKRAWACSRLLLRLHPLPLACTLSLERSTPAMHGSTETGTTRQRKNSDDQRVYT